MNGVVNPELLIDKEELGLLGQQSVLLKKED